MQSVNLEDLDLENELHHVHKDGVQFRWSKLVCYVEAFAQNPDWHQIPQQRYNRAVEVIYLIKELKQYKLSHETCDLFISLHEELLGLMGKDIQGFLGNNHQ
jgi:hypothetical protein